TMVNYTRTRRVVFSCAALGAAVLLSGCVATQDWVNETVGAQVQTLTTRVSRLETNVNEVNAQVGQLGPQLAASRAAVGAVDSRVTHSLATRLQPEMVSQLPLLFTTGKYELTQAHMNALNTLLKTLQDNPTYTADLVGFTDDVGTARSNVLLSWHREESVRRY